MGSYTVRYGVNTPLRRAVTWRMVHLVLFQELMVQGRQMNSGTIRNTTSSQCDKAYEDLILVPSNHPMFVPEWGGALAGIPVGVSGARACSTNVQFRLCERLVRRWALIHSWHKSLQPQ